MSRNNQFRQNSILFLLPAFVILVLTGCEKPSINFGNGYSNENTTNVVVTDTFRVDLSTVFVDSFSTAATGSILVGRYKDPYFGTIASESFLQVSPPSSLPTISNLAIYDSLALILRINKTYYGDTTVVQRYMVSQLQSLIQLPGVQTTFYNNSTFPYDASSPLGYSDVQINPTAFFTSQKINDTIKIRLPDSKGLELFRLLYNQADTVKNINTFTGYFKGLSIYPDANSTGGIFGFKDSIIMRLYYREPGIVLTEKFVDFNIYNKSNQFNHIWTDRTGTPASGIDSIHNEVPSTATGNAAYVQSATGLQVKIKFPTIGSLQQYPDYLSILKAELIVRPVQGTYSPTFVLPPQLNVSLTNDGNLVGSTVGAANASVDYLSGANTNYSYDITAYIKQQITAGVESNNRNGLMLNIPSPAYNTTFNRAVIGDRFKSQPINQIILKIYYASFY
jgi:hypothetical protein